MKLVLDNSRQPPELIIQSDETDRQAANQEIEAAYDQLNVLIDALNIYVERNKLYKDNWRRYGWRGCLYDLRRKVERCWDVLWSAPSLVDAVREDQTDDLLDVINYAAITVRAVRENNRDGEGSWWG